MSQPDSEKLLIGCYLIRRGGFESGQEALREVERLRSAEETANKPSPETDGQRDMVRTWSE